MLTLDESRTGGNRLEQIDYLIGPCVRTGVEMKSSNFSRIAPNVDVFAGVKSSL